MHRINLLKPWLGLSLARRRQSVVLCGFISTLFWLIRYRYSGQFGLYEDDLTIIPRAVQMGQQEVLMYVGQYIATLQGHMRPLSDSFIYLFSNLGWRLGLGFQGLYVIGFIVEALNLCLLFVLVARLADVRLAALVALAYALYSVDTTQPFLTHSLGVHPSITLLLLSLHTYLSQRYWLSYLLAFLILFSYETPFPLFLVAPLLTIAGWERRAWPRLAWHGLIVAGMLLAVTLLRMNLGDTRVNATPLSQLIWSAISNMARGPVMNVWAYAIRLQDVWAGFTIPGVIVFALGGLGLVAAFLTWMPEKDLVSEPGKLSPGRLAIIALLLLTLGYALIFTTAPDFFYGRASRAHMAAGLGSAFLAGLAAYQFLEIIKHKWLGTLLVAALCAPLVGFGFLLQVDYIHAWRAQQQFWSELLPLISDASPNDVILVEPGIFSTTALLDANHIGANTWNMPRVLDQLYVFNTDDVPQVFRLDLNWEQSVLNSDGTLNLNVNTVYAPQSMYETVQPENVIYIQFEAGHMIRRSAAFVLDGQPVPVKPFQAENQTRRPIDFLYHYMIISTP